ncbi:MAG TPA: permease prefix domain 1-containing protein [Rhizomicrobium sp.]|nr:permease prefix domain 1-containing protein [Rhizomicrobium sp.]
MRFDALGEILLAGGIAPRHVRRYLAELSEHLDDLTAEQRAAGFDPQDAAIRARARLGDDAELAQAMLARKEFRSWAARAPWAFFGLLPPLVTVLTAFVVVTPLVLSAKIAGLIGHGGINATGWFRMLAAVLFAFGNFAVPPLLAAGFVRLAQRQRMRPLWAVLAILMIALVDLKFQAHFPAPGHQGGSVGVGAGLWLYHAHDLIEDWQLSLTQLLLTLTPAFRLIRRGIRA